nr:MAG TPA: hypothetical protein [Caudoviricetes sp.]
MRVLTSLFLPGREGTGKSEGVPPGRWAAFGRCVIMWAANGERIPNVFALPVLFFDNLIQTSTPVYYCLYSAKGGETEA